MGGVRLKRLIFIGESAHKKKGAVLYTMISL